MTPRFDLEGKIEWDIDNSVVKRITASSPSPFGVRQVRITNGRFLSPLAKHLPKASEFCHFSFVQPLVTHDYHHQEQQQDGCSDDQSTRSDKNNKEDINTTARPSRTKPLPRVVVIMLPATGEVTNTARLWMAYSLARQHGYSSIVVTCPLYGVRKPADQTAFFIPTVEKIGYQAQGIMEEGASLACYFLAGAPGLPLPLSMESCSGDDTHIHENIGQDDRDNGAAAAATVDVGNQFRVCLTGFSFGGAMASGATALAALGTRGMIRPSMPRPASRLACAPYVGCGSPVVIADGIISGGVDWSALSLNQQNKPMLSSSSSSWSSISSSNRTALHTQAELLTYFRDYDIRTFVDMLCVKNDNYVGAIRMVGTPHDAFINRYWAEFFANKLRPAVGPKGTVVGSGLDTTKTQPRNGSFGMRWIPGGHVTAFLRKAYAQEAAIVEAVKSLEE